MPKGVYAKRTPVRPVPQVPQPVLTAQPPVARIRPEPQPPRIGFAIRVKCRLTGDIAEFHYARQP
jgi:hypothetical protein